MAKSFLKIFIRKAGFWNSKNFEISSQFGHIMLDIDDIFYSFNQGKFLPEGNNSNVQKINKKKFNDLYRNQIWHVVTLSFTKKEIMKILSYFNEDAKDFKYSLLNNCTKQCQIALEKANLKFPHYFIFPGSMLNFLKNKNNNMPKLKIEKIKISKKWKE